MIDRATDPHTPRAGAVPMLGLFVIWPIARPSAGPILDDLAGRFEVLQLIEMTWSEQLVRRNYERFYSDLDVAGVYHEVNKGRGPFLAAVVHDHAPVIEMRPTARGRRLVSANFVDAKTVYRHKLGNMGVHCGENEWESNRDTAVLLGLAPDDLLATGETDGVGSTRSIHRDPTGADGWSSLEEMLSFLNPIVPYVAISGTGREDAPVQLLTPEPHTLHTLIDGRSIDGHPRPLGGRFVATIAGRGVPVEVRSVGSGFIDERWADAVVAGRRPDDAGVMRAPPGDDLALRAYLAVTRQRTLSAIDLATIHALGEVPTDTASVLDRRAAVEIVSRHLGDRGYRFVRPDDPTILVYDANDRIGRRRIRYLRAGVATAWARIIGHGRAFYLRFRAWAIVRLPGLRARWRRRRRRE